MNAKLEWRVPRYLDEMPKLLFMDLHQALIMLLFFAAGLSLGFLLGGMLFGALASWAFNRLKTGRHPRFLLHLAYWHLPAWFVPFSCTPPAHYRFYLG